MSSCSCCYKQLSSDSHTPCVLCQKQTYCSEECRTTDWVHYHHDECPNTINIASPNDVVFLPYNFEDCLSSETQISSPIINQSYQLRHDFQNGKVGHKIIQPNIGKKQESNSLFGLEPMKKGDKYSIKFELDGKSLGEIQGSFDSDMIYRNCNQGVPFPGATQETDYLFWPNPEQVSRKSIILPQQGERLSITLSAPALGDGITHVSGPYKMQSETAYRDLSSTWKRQLNPRRDEGFNTGLRDFKMIRAQDVHGNTFVLGFNNRENRLVDLMVKIPRANFLIQQKSVENHVFDVQNRTYCDPMNIDHITGLCMAVQERIAENKQELEEMIRENSDPNSVDIKDCKSQINVLEKHFNVLLKHQRNLEQAIETNQEHIELPTQVSVAVNNALDSLSEIGVRLPSWRRRQYRKLLTRSVDLFVQKGDEVARALEDAWILEISAINIKPQTEEEIKNQKKELRRAEREKKKQQANATDLLKIISKVKEEDRSERFINKIDKMKTKLANAMAGMDADGNAFFPPRD